jgi:Fe-S oxidoreductase
MLNRSLTASTLEHKLKRYVKGEVLFDLPSRVRYSGLYQNQIQPIGVVIPRNESDVFMAIEIARDYAVSIFVRGAGTSISANGLVLVIDTSCYLTALLKVDAPNLTAVVQPGITLDALNHQLKAFGLWFPMQLTTGGQATIGGMAGNNVSNQYRLDYGDMIHNVLGIDAILSDGTEAYMGNFGLNAQPLTTVRMRQLVSQLFSLTTQHRQLINDNAFSIINTDTVNYNLGIFSDCLPTSVRPYTIDGSVNLAHLLVGSQGTLAYFKRLHLKLAYLPKDLPKDLPNKEVSKNITEELLSANSDKCSYVSLPISSQSNSNSNSNTSEWAALLKQIKYAFDPDGRMWSEPIAQLIVSNKLSSNKLLSNDKSNNNVNSLGFLPNYLSHAINQCDNAGACRTTQVNIACPSYLITRQEKHSTRGRVNTIRFILNTDNLNPSLKSNLERITITKNPLSSPILNDAMTLCVGCKACKQHCPASIDITAVKSLMLVAQRDERIRLGQHTLKQRLREYLVSELPYYVPRLKKIRWLINTRVVHRCVTALLGYANLKQGRSLPKLSKVLLKTPAININNKKVCNTNNTNNINSINNTNISKYIDNKTVILWVDTFNNAFETANIQSAYTVLSAAGYQVYTTDALSLNRPLCCGRSQLAVGNIDAARKSASTMIAAVLPFIEQGATLVGLEPACLLMAHDEWLSMGLGESAQYIKNNALLFENFLVREVSTGRLNLKQLNLQALPYPYKTALIHGHCHQKALNMMSAVTQVLNWIPNLHVSTIQSACCGMVGSFGYEAKTFETSMAMVRLNVLPAIQASDNKTLIVANGFSCRHQIKDATQRQALHIARVLEMAIK